jgi:uncharacterized surface protein with fasciclin (FAS1) repeats
MKTRTLTALLAGAALLVSLPLAAYDYNKKDIVATASEAGSFNTLVTAIQAAGLVEALQGDGPFTVFAPTDEAFAKLPEGTLDSLLKPENVEKLRSILTYHVVPSKVMAADVADGASTATLQGDSLSFSLTDGEVRIGDAKVINTDIATSNGVIHVIDTVLLPQ